MKILISIGHPAHVHFFKYIIQILEKNGHTFKFVARDKDVTLKLLDAYNFNYNILPKHRSSLLLKAYDRVLVTKMLYKLARKYQPDLLIGIGGVDVSHVGILIKKPSIMITDTEHASLSNNLAAPFATTILTPSCFKKDFGAKQVRYNGYHELAYLHPNYFKPDASVLDELGLKENERFVILRFVAWSASHDVGQKGISPEIQRVLVRELKKHTKVLITSENKLPTELEPYRITVEPEKIHDLLYYADLYIGEGGTMASEAAVLGTPAIYVNTLRMGYTDEEENKYNLLFNFSDSDDLSKNLINKAIELISSSGLKEEWKEKKDILLSDKIDVTSFVVNFIEKWSDINGEITSKNR